MMPVLKQLFDFVAGAEVAGLQLAELAAYEFPSYLGNTVNEHVALQMVQFMFHHTASETVELLGNGFPFLVDVPDGYALRADNVAVDIRNAEAAL